MDSDQKELTITKSVLLTIVVVIFGIFLFCYKTESCKNTPENCHDTFVQFSSNYSPKCYPGAVMEIVKDPKPGVICHCVTNVIDGGLK